MQQPENKACCKSRTECAQQKCFQMYHLPKVLGYMCSSEALSPRYYAKKAKFDGLADDVKSSITRDFSRITVIPLKHFQSEFNEYSNIS